MKFETHSDAPARPAWTYSVPPPQILSALWVLEILASLSIPIAGIAVLAAAIAFGWIPVD